MMNDNWGSSFKYICDTNNKKIYNKKAVTMLLIQNGYFPTGN